LKTHLLLAFESQANQAESAKEDGVSAKPTLILKNVAHG
jgi:hypothetical protein